MAPVSSNGAISSEPRLSRYESGQYVQRPHLRIQQVSDAIVSTSDTGQVATALSGNTGCAVRGTWTAVGIAYVGAAASPPASFRPLSAPPRSVPTSTAATSGCPPPSAPPS